MTVALISCGFEFSYHYYKEGNLIHIGSLQQAQCTILKNYLEHIGDAMLNPTCEKDSLFVLFMRVKLCMLIT